MDFSLMGHTYGHQRDSLRPYQHFLLPPPFSAGRGTVHGGDYTNLKSYFKNRDCSVEQFSPYHCFIVKSGDLNKYSLSSSWSECEKNVSPYIVIKNNEIDMFYLYITENITICVIKYIKIKLN